MCVQREQMSVFTRRDRMRLVGALELAGCLPHALCGLSVSAQVLLILRPVMAGRVADGPRTPAALVTHNPPWGHHPAAGPALWRPHTIWLGRLAFHASAWGERHIASREPQGVGPGLPGRCLCPVARPDTAPAEWPPSPLCLSCHPSSHTP